MSGLFTFGDVGASFFGDTEALFFGDAEAFFSDVEGAFFTSGVESLPSTSVESLASIGVDFLILGVGAAPGLTGKEGGLATGAFSFDGAKTFSGGVEVGLSSRAENVMVFRCGTTGGL